MALNVGLNLIEVDGKATPALQAADTSVAGFVILSARGVSGVVHEVTSFNQFTQLFGGFMDGAFGAYVVRGFFDNGGVRAFITRVVDSTAKAATHDFLNATDATALTLSAAHLGKADLGGWGNSLSCAVLADPDDANLFSLVIRLKGVVVETWSKLNVGGTGVQSPLKLNEPFTGSSYVRVSLPATLVGNPKPTLDDHEVAFVNLAGGTDGTGLTSAASAKLQTEALSLFDTENIQLFACPETNASDPNDKDMMGLVVAALSYCQARGDCMFVGHVPDALKVTDVKGWVKTNALRGDKVYGALYFPFIRVADPIGTQKHIPPTGHVMGVYARTERERGIWKAPAGNAAKVNNALDVRYEITDIQHTDLVKNAGVNAVRPIAGQGIVVDSSRTLSTNTLWLYVNVRLLFNFVESTLKSGLRWTVQEPNDPTLWNKVKFNSVVPFLMGLWRRGAFGPGAPSDVFSVKVDAENNPPQNIQQGLLNIEVYFYPSRPAETIVITVGQQEGGAKVNEA